MKVLLFSAHAVLAAPIARVAVIAAVVSAGFPFAAHAASIDFTQDVQAALHGTAPASSGILGQEYRTAWDEFGTSVLVPGTATGANISQSIINDIVQSAGQEVGYEQQEYQYLKDTHSTPLEVQAVESNEGSDVSPEEAVDPQPSLTANPDIEYSSVTDLQSLDGPVDDDAGASASDAASATDTSTAPTDIPASPSDVPTLEAITGDTPAADSSADAAPTDSSTPAPTDAPPADASAPAGP